MFTTTLEEFTALDARAQFELCLRLQIRAANAEALLRAELQKKQPAAAGPEFTLLPPHTQTLNTAA